MKTSSVSFRSAMRPEYLAEFEQAGVAPPSDLPLRDQVETRVENRTQKVILTDPGISDNVVAANLAAVAVGMLQLLLLASMLAIGMMIAVVAGFVKASRKGSRRGT